MIEYFRYDIIYLNPIYCDAQTDQLRKVTMIHYAFTLRFQKCQIPILPWLEIQVTSLSYCKLVINYVL